MHVSIYMQLGFNNLQPYNPAFFFLSFLSFFYRSCKLSPELLSLILIFHYFHICYHGFCPLPFMLNYILLA